MRRAPRVQPEHDISVLRDGAFARAATMEPQPIDVAVASDNPRVVIVCKQMGPSIRTARSKLCEHWRDRQQVADLVALDDEDLQRFFAIGSSRSARIGDVVPVTARDESL